MSRRNYNAFIKAARKTGGLSLPAARKAYKKITDRLGRPAKGNDVSKHPRIFKQSITAKSGRRLPGFKDTRTTAGPGRYSTTQAPTRKRSDIGRGSVKRVSGKSRQAPAETKRGTRRGVVSREKLTPRPSRVVVEPPRLLARAEYVSTPEYTKRSSTKGRFHLALQIHIVGPAGLDRKTLDGVASDWLQGKGVPGEFEVKALGWNNREPTSNKLKMRVARSSFRKIPFTF